MADAVAKWRGGGLERALAPVVARAMALGGGRAHPARLAASVRAALGPLGARPEGKVSRQELAARRREKGEEGAVRAGSPKAKA
jgi:hypothetical protein